jgi:hypothetical protein
VGRNSGVAYSQKLSIFRNEEPDNGLTILPTRLLHKHLPDQGVDETAGHIS